MNLDDNIIEDMPKFYNLADRITKIRNNKLQYIKGKPDDLPEILKRDKNDRDLLYLVVFMIMKIELLSFFRNKKDNFANEESFL